MQMELLIELTHWATNCTERHLIKFEAWRGGGVRNEPTLCQVTPVDK